MLTTNEIINSAREGDTPHQHKSWRDWEDIDFGSYSYVRHIYNDLEKRDGFSSAKEVANTVGMGFTKQNILDICKEQNDPIPSKELDGIPYITIEPFLDKFIGELKWEEVTPSIFPEYEAQMQEVIAQCGWRRRIRRFCPLK